MEKLDDETVERILGQLPTPSDLAAAQLACKQWWNLISTRQLWKPHALGCTSSTAGKNVTPASRQSREPVDWRTVCLDRFAAQRWRSGKLLLSATLQGHTSPVTSVAVLDNIVLTGSSDHTARLWSLEHHKPQTSRAGQQQHQQTVMQHPAPVVAVGLVSVDICLTATASQAFLWRRGTAVRQFDVMPGGSITSIALTDTQLLVGSTAGTVQQFDLYSGAQQLITRYERGVTALLTHQQQQQQEKGSEQDWSVIVGTADGQVVCSSCCTGQQLWKLPNRYPAGVVALNITQCGNTHQQLDQLSNRPSKQHQQQRASNRQHQQPDCLQGTRQKQQQLLLVLNSKSQLICWILPSSSNSSSKCSSSNSSMSWPLTMLSLQESQDSKVFSRAAVVRSTGMVVPLFGSGCLIVVNSDGSLTLIELADGNRGDSRSKSSRSSLTAAGRHGRVESDNSSGNAVATTTVDRQGTPGTLKPGDLDHQQRDTMHLSGTSEVSSHSHPQQQDTAAQHERLELLIIRRCSLQKLSKVLACRKPAKTASNIHRTSSSGIASRRSINSVVGGSQQCRGGGGTHSASCLVGRDTQVVGVSADAGNGAGVHAGIKCMAFTATGRLVVGLESGHVCLLKFKQPQAKPDAVQ